MCSSGVFLIDSHLRPKADVLPMQGFRMVAGNPNLRSKTGRLPGICHRCNGNGEGGVPCDSRDTSEFPLKMCPGGIRATVIFPTCWDGKNLDSPDHSSHMAYAPGTTATSALAGPNCPSSHPIRVPQVMYEIMLDTKPFNKAEYFANGKQPFVYSFGDGFVSPVCGFVVMFWS